MKVVARELRRCEGCGIDFRPMRRTAAGRFCSLPCYLAWRRRTGSEERICVRCGQTFTSWKSDPKKYCSRECYRKRLFGNTLARDALGRRWSWKHDCCIECGTTERPHYAKGRCRLCDGRRRARAARGSLGRACQICGERRAIETAHIVPRTLIGERWDAWLLLYLCPTHHRLYDAGRLSEEEWGRIRARVEVALALLADEGTKIVSFARPVKEAIGA